MRRAIDAALTRLNGQFPDLPVDVIRSVFGDSYRIVVEVSGEPLVDKAEELTRLRLEMRTRHPAKATSAPAKPADPSSVEATA